jgi:hypothetical protein
MELKKKYWVNLSAVATATLSVDGTLTLSLSSRETFLFSGQEAADIWNLLDASRRGVIFHV